MNANALLDFAETIGCYDMPIDRTRALAEAVSNWSANRGSIGRSQPRMLPWLDAELPAVEWLFGRDRTLAARHLDRTWVGGSSAPLLAARAMLDKFTITNTAACFVWPTHGIQLVEALARLRRDQALLAVVPDLDDASFLLASADLSPLIDSGRLFFAWGAAWDRELQKLFESVEGLPPTSQLIRSPLLEDSTWESMLRLAESVVAAATGRHRLAIAALQQQSPAPRHPARRICFVAASSDSLWADADALPAELVSGPTDVRRIDLSRPAESSSLHFLRTASACDAILTTNIARADHAGLLSTSIPWVCWLTQARIPAFVAGADADVLIAAEESIRRRAIAAGWPADRVLLGSEAPIAFKPSPGGVPTIVCDLTRLVMPDSVKEFSSHRLVWEQIESELRADILSPRIPVDEFLNNRASRQRVSVEHFPINVFRQELIAPLFVREFARQWIARGKPLRLIGRGWNTLEFARPYHASDGRTGDIAQASSDAGSILDVWPADETHPARRRLATVPTWGWSWQIVFDRAARPAAFQPGPALSADILGQALRLAAASQSNPASS